MEFAEFGGFAATNVASEEVITAVFAGDGAIDFVGKAGGCGSGGAGGGEVNIKTAIGFAGQDQGFAGITGFKELIWVEGHKFRG